MRRIGLCLLTTIAILSAGSLAARSESPSVLTRHVREAVLNGQAPPWDVFLRTRSCSWTSFFRCAIRED